MKEADKGWLMIRIGVSECTFLLVPAHLDSHVFSALTLLVGQQQGIRPVKKLSDGMLAWLCVWVKV